MISCFSMSLSACKDEYIDCTIDGDEILYTMPEESSRHEGTWLQWPHQYQYGIEYRNSLDATWVAITKALCDGEKVHIIAYDERERKRILELLENANVSLKNIDFRIYPTDDVWIRDNGPIYVKDKKGDIVILNWGFNGWGEKANFGQCDVIPEQIARDQKLLCIDLDVMISEGGSIELDGAGTLMATRSSILNYNRNPNMTQQQAEALFKKYLGVTNYVWLDGVSGLDITDMHIDGFARFVDSVTIITMNSFDLQEWEVPDKDINILYGAKNKHGVAYKMVIVPLTKHNVRTEQGNSLGYKGSYVNYYIANNKILVPNYNDANDAVANAIIQRQYPDREVVGIDVRNLYENGGMVHCVTQQQPQQ